MGKKTATDGSQLGEKTLPNSDPARRPLKVLAVDSGKVARKWIISEFKDQGFQISEASDLQEAARLAFMEKFEVITVGLYFREGTGFDLCNSIRKDRINGKPFASSDAKILFITSEYNDSNRIKAHDAGADGFLEKKPDLTPLKETLQLIIKDLKSEIPGTEDRHTKDASRLKSVLMVDDSELNLVLSKRLLESKGLKVQTAISGEHALRILLEEPEKYEALLTDMYMPGMNGDCLCARVMQESKFSGLKLAIITASNELDSETDKIPSNVKILVKPFDADEIVDFVSAD
ncbi:response regulator [Leptospira fletcheri]|uniref:Response regulator n=1 Tax=Leptospira fletcheri TaxID=2484981 RepID=A0A4R9GFT1_9LEPT|nr:response regulator [Leptospira fletcheri]TGK11534.1 response regulator [Leptospira fletcheri]